MADFKRVKELFLAAAEVADPAARAAHLSAACGDDHDLRRQVEELLRDEPETGFLSRPAAAHLASTSPDEPGDTDPQDSTDDAGLPAVPGYLLGGRVGRGGMGVVYRARDTRLNRDVAIKFLRAGPAADPSSIRRFRQEAELTARLSHPGIPPVHELGELADGQPFLAMKLVAGHTLADLLRDRPDQEAGRGRLLATFEGVCQAVGYAHSRGVIHRDLKPANVMVGEFGEVQVMDWGLAREMRNAECEVRSGDDPHTSAGVSSTPRSAFRLPNLTGAGSLLGTPGYMAPEQARGEPADARSDVFGLGAILCAILTGEPPFVGNAWEDVVRANAVGDTADAGARLAGCGADGDLIALCERCLSRDPADRPADGGAVAAEVAAWRAGTEERARRAEVDRATAEARATGERRRRRVLVGAAAAVAVVLAAGAAVSLWQMLRAVKAEEDTANQLVLTRKAEGEARRAEGEARKAEGEARTESAKARAAETVAVNESADTKAFSDFLVNHVLATGRPVGVQNGLGVDVKMADALRAAEKQLDKVFAGRPKAEATARYALGVTWRNLSDFQAAEKHLVRAVELRRRELGPTARDTRLATIGLAVLYAETGRFADAAPLQKEALEAYRAELGDAHLDTLACALNLGDMYLAADKLDDAEAVLVPTAETSIEALGVGHPQTIGARASLAGLHARRGKLKQAEADFRALLADCRRIHGRRNMDTIEVGFKLTMFLLTTGRSNDAAPLAEEVLEDCRALYGPRHRLTLSAMNNLGGVRNNQQRFDDADALLTEAAAGNRAVMGAGHEQTVISLLNLGHAKTGRRREEEAAERYGEAFAAGGKPLGLDHPAVRMAGLCYGETKLRLDRPADAVPVLKELWGSLLLAPSGDPDRERCQSNLGLALAGVGKPVEALTHLRNGASALARRANPDPRARDRRVAVLRALVDVCEKLERTDAAARWRAELAGLNK